MAREAVLAASKAASTLPQTQLADGPGSDWTVVNSVNSKLGVPSFEPFVAAVTSPDNEDAAAPLPGAAARLAAKAQAEGKVSLLQGKPSEGDEGEAEAKPSCEADCSGHGFCEASGQCICEHDWIGSICDMPMCPSNCNDRGLCVQGKCVCEGGWHGSACHLKRCPNDCSGAGYCFKGKCECMEGFHGESCAEVKVVGQTMVVKLKHAEPSQARPGLDSFKETASLHELGGASCPENCNNRGICTSAGNCRCMAGYSGEACEAFCPNECSGQGRCIEGGCLCFAGFTGVDCSQQGCCSGHGSCDVPGTCECDIGWGGPECSIELKCPDPTCSSHGKCVQGTCDCEAGWAGPRCAAPTGGCIPQCGEQGKCNIETKKCECEDGYTGDDCTVKIQTCPNNCNFKGLCLHGFCMCGAGWSGEDCGRRYFAPGSLATMTGKSPADDEKPGGLSGSDFAIDASGRRADVALDEDMGSEPQIGLDYQPSSTTTFAPPPPVMNPMAAAGLTAPGEAAVPAGPGGGAMSPQAVTSLAIQNQEAQAAGRLAFSLASAGKICGEGGFCSGHGACNTETGRCECHSGFTGDVCHEERCPGFAEVGADCYGHGICESGKCSCASGWGGTIQGSLGLMLTCQEKVCSVDCGKHGSCSEGFCQCMPGWQGETCEDPHCTSGCNGHGKCGSPSPDYPGSCSCEEGWSGAECEIALMAQEPPKTQRLRHREVAAVALSKGFSTPKHKHQEVSAIRLPVV